MWLNGGPVTTGGNKKIYGENRIKPFSSCCQTPGTDRVNHHTVGYPNNHDHNKYEMCHCFSVDQYFCMLNIIRRTWNRLQVLRVALWHFRPNLPLTRDRSHVRKAFGSPIYHFCFKFPKYNLSPKKYPIMIIVQVHMYR